jgi:hypothetical protein
MRGLQLFLQSAHGTPRFRNELGVKAAYGSHISRGEGMSDS